MLAGFDAGKALREGRIRRSNLVRRGFLGRLRQTGGVGVVPVAVDAVVLAAFLVIGFFLRNASEGVAIAAPLSGRARR